MKKLPDHLPKDNSWDKILEKGTFENQLNSLIPDLPVFEPNSNSWAKIEAKIAQDQPKPVFWLRKVAAVLLVFLIGLAWVISHQSSSDKSITTETNLLSETEQITEPVTVTPVIPKSETSENVPSNESPKTQISESQHAVVPQKKTADPVPIIALELPELEIPKPEIKRPELAQISKASGAALPEERKTLHQVSISWRKTKPGLKVTTSFGKMESELAPQPSASTSQTNQLILEINN